MVRDFVSASAARSSGLFFFPAIFHFIKWWQWFGSLQVIDDGEVLVEIREQQDRQIKREFVPCRVGLPEVALLLLGLYAGFDCVGVSDFAAVFEFLLMSRKCAASASARWAVAYFLCATTSP